MKKQILFSIFVIIISLSYAQNFNIKQENGIPNLLYNTHAFSPAGEDNDGLAEGGETISMPINIYNSGTDTARNISALLICTHTDITITDYQADYENIGSDENVWSNEPYTFLIIEECEQQMVEFVLICSSEEGSWTTTFDVEIFPANIEITPNLLYNTHSYNPAGTDNDGVVESGETIYMPINIYNSGTAVAQNISAQLSCSNSDITMLVSSQNYNNLGSDGNTWSLGDFSFSVDDNAEEQTIEFLLEITSDEGSWTSNFSITIYPQSVEPQPFLLYNTHAYNPAGEDDDGIVESGESISMSVNIYNSGTADANNITASLICTDTDITITNFQTSFDNLTSDEDMWSTNDFTFEVSEDCIEKDIDFILEMSTDEGSWTSTFVIEVYEQTTPPMPHLIYNTHAYNTAGDDNDGVVESGESITMPINIYNSGTDTARNISAVLYCSNSDIEITNSQATFNNLGSDGDAWTNSGFSFDVANDAEEQEVEFGLVISSDEGSWTNVFSINIYPQSLPLQPNLIYNTHVYNPAGEDNDGVVENGESILMPINLFNSGTDTARNISAILICIDPDIMITDYQKNFENMGSDQNAWSIGSFGFDVAEDCEEHEVEFVLAINADEGSWTSSFTLMVYPQNPPLLPNLLYNTHAYNPAGDDDDGIVESGESITMPINIYNSGTDTARNITATLSCLDEDILITNETKNYTDLISDQDGWGDSGFIFEVDENAEEHEVEFTLEMTSDEGTWNSSFTIMIYPQSGPVQPNLIYNTHAYNPAGEDNDGVVESGESIVMPINIYNSGTDTAHNVFATLVCQDTSITITDSQKSFPNLLSDEDGWSASGFGFDVADNAVEHEVVFTLAVNSDEGSWISTFSLIVYPQSQPIAPQLVYNTHTYDPAGEDDDGVPESGETIVMPINIYNAGTDTARNISAILICTDPDISIIDYQKTFDNIISDTNAWSNEGFVFEISEECEEHEVSFILVVTSDEGSWNSTFVVEVYGHSNPAGPNLFYNNHAFAPAGDDNDGLAEGGESIVMPISIYNGGTDTAHNISAQITCLDPNITITTGLRTFDNVISDGEAWSIGGFAFDIAFDVVEHEAEFILEITSDEGSWTSPFMVEIYPPDMPFVPFLLYNNHSFAPAGSDNDGIAEGGENISMPVSIFNSGVETATGVSAVIICSDPDITITSDHKTFNDIVSDGEVWSNGAYEFSIDENCVEHDVSFVFIISTNDETWSDTFVVHIYPKDAFGISELDEDESIIYPNPNSGLFNIKTENLSSGTQYQILNANGKLIKTGYIQNDGSFKKQINMNNLESGLYLLRLTENNKSVDYKFVVQ